MKMTNTNIKECRKCERKFSWKDYGSDQKFYMNSLCPNCKDEEEMENMLTNTKKEEHLNI